MKLLLAPILFALSSSAIATHWLTYHIYFETEYVQGPWSGADLLDPMDQRYLEARTFSGNFGTVPESLVLAMLAELYTHRPELYDSSYTVHVFERNVMIEIPERRPLTRTMIDEVTSTLTMNNFDTVIFRVNRAEERYTRAHISLPMMRLVLPNDTISKVPGPSNDEGQAEEVPQEVVSTTTDPWVIGSLLLNVVLLGLLVYRRKG